MRPHSLRFRVNSLGLLFELPREESVRRIGRSLACIGVVRQFGYITCVLYVASLYPLTSRKNLAFFSRSYRSHLLSIVST